MAVSELKCDSYTSKYYLGMGSDTDLDHVDHKTIFNFVERHPELDVVLVLYKISLESMLWSSTF